MSSLVPNARRQRPSEINATLGPPFASSSGEKLRPRAGCTPSASIRLAVTVAVVTRIGSDVVVTFEPPVVHAPMFSHDCASFLISPNSGGDIQNLRRSIVGNSL